MVAPEDRNNRGNWIGEQRGTDHSDAERTYAAGSSLVARGLVVATDVNQGEEHDRERAQGYQHANPQNQQGDKLRRTQRANDLVKLITARRERRRRFLDKRPDWES